ncbi:hypothetical protein BaRGS_00035479 [Batillaria attramentaria]|uniref:AIG1-type G domain-containing protein n=1 Tax=Batillaria attramentaria TaxID=370345 RepID=A0ABD0JEV8_9CAEN
MALSHPALPERYKMTADPHGICIIINNKNFKGGDGDLTPEQLTREGTDIDRGYPSAVSDTDPEAEKLIPGAADFLLAYSTVPGYVAFRDGKGGSYFICKLTEILDTHADRLDIIKILTMVNKELSTLDIYVDTHGHCKQCPGQLTTLTKDLYLGCTPVTAASSAGDDGLNEVRNLPMDESGNVFSDPEAEREHPDANEHEVNNEGNEDFELVERERLILIIGKTGTGKSTVGNILVGGETFRVGQEGQSSTTVPSLCTPSTECLLKVVDTIDIDNMKLKYQGRKDEVSRWKTICGGEPDIILLTARCDIPYTAEDYDFYCQMKRLWGDEKEFCSHLVVGFTFGDRLQFDIAGKTAECPELEQVLKDAGGHYVVFNSKADTGSSRSEPMDESVYFPSAHEAGLEHAGEQMQSENNDDLEDDFEHIDNERVVIIFGKTASGKSSVGNILLNEEKFRVGQPDMSPTDAHSCCSPGACSIKVVDTIDIDNMELTYEGRKDEVSRWKTICGGEPDIILLTARCDIPYTAEDYDFYCQIKRLWGDEKEFCSHLVVGFTFGDRLQFDIAGKTAECPELEQVLKDAGGHYVVFNSKADTDHKMQQKSNLMAIDRKKCEEWVVPESGSPSGLLSISMSESVLSFAFPEVSNSIIASYNKFWSLAGFSGEDACTGLFCGSKKCSVFHWTVTLATLSQFPMQSRNTPVYSFQVVDTQTDCVIVVDTQTDCVIVVDTQTDCVIVVDTQTDCVIVVDTQTDCVIVVDTQTDCVIVVDTQTDCVIVVDTQTDCVIVVDTQTDCVIVVDTQTDCVIVVDTQTDCVIVVDTQTDCVIVVDTQTDCVIIVSISFLGANNAEYNHRQSAVFTFLKQCHTYAILFSV